MREIFNSRTGNYRIDELELEVMSEMFCVWELKLLLVQILLDLVM